MGVRQRGQDFFVGYPALENFLGDEAVCFDIGGKSSGRRVGDEGWFEGGADEILDGGAPHARVCQEKVFAGDTAFGSREIECDRVEISSHAAQADGGVHTQGQQAKPSRQAVDYIHRGQVDKTPFFPQVERDNFGVRKLGLCQRSDIRSHSDDEIFLTQFPRHEANASCCEDEVADGVGFENENAQARSDRVGRGGSGAALSSPIRVEELSTGLVYTLVGVGTKEVALGLEQVRWQDR